MTPASQVEVHVDGQSSGVAFLSASASGAELCVVGKLSIVLLGDGQAAIVARPEPPGIHGGLAVPAELDAAAAGTLLVTGARMAPGRVVLRRGTIVLAEAAFGPGVEPAVVTATALYVPAGPDVLAAGEEEWLVVEGGTAVDARRWCKLPKMKLVASWEPSAELVLGSRACFVDLATWTVSFVLRGTLPLAAPAPRVVMVSVEDTFVSSVRERSRSIEPLPSAPTIDEADDADDDEAVRTAVRGPGAYQGGARALDDSPTDEQKTRLIQIPVEMPPEALPESSTRRGPSRRAGRTSRAGLRLGPSEVARPASPPIEEETTVVAKLPVETGPSSVTRAFAALSPDGSSAVAPAEARSELLRRIQQGERLDGLDVRGALLAGVSLAGAPLSGIDLTGADLRGANLAGTDLRGARLDGAQLDGARLDGASLEDASLVGASLRSVTLAGASFAGADLTGAQIGSSHAESVFAGARLDGVRRV